MHVEDLGQYALVCLASALAILVGWWRLRDNSLRLSNRRWQPLLRLLESERWRGVPPLVLQKALKDVVGQQMDEREFEFILSRHNPLRLLGCRKGAGDGVTFCMRSFQYVDSRSKPWLSLKHMRQIGLGLPFLLCVPMVVFGIWAANTDPYHGTLIVAYFVAAICWLLRTGLRAEWAMDVISLKGHEPLGGQWTESIHLAKEGKKMRRT